MYSHSKDYIILSSPTNALMLVDQSLKLLITLPRGYPYASPSERSPNHSLPITGIIFSQNKDSLENFITFSTDRSVRFWNVKEKRALCVKTLIYTSTQNKDFKFIKGVSFTLKESSKQNFGYLMLTEVGKLILLRHLTVLSITKSPNYFIEDFCDVKQHINCNNMTLYTGLLNIDDKYIVLLEAESGTLIIINIPLYLEGNKIKNADKDNKPSFIKTVKNNLLQTNHSEHFKMDFIKYKEEHYVLFIPLNNGYIGNITINLSFKISNMEFECLNKESDNICITCEDKEHIFVGNSKGEVYYSFINKSLFKRKKKKNEIITSSVIKSVGEYKEEVNLKEDTKKVKLSHKYGNFPIEKQLKPGQGKENM
eukprot:GAHX01001916.1.p1 GENE.GAHX01001916.1~~GAHX01001916.1.p1  ORF type:complete len:367 (+),score=61.27 GAHX01001916.1:785-1885(+)